jgi:hypothetical protein
MKIFYPVFFLVTLVLVSCEFEPSGEFHPDIEEPRYPPATLIYLDAVDDTIFISPGGSISFSFYTGERKILGMEVCIDNNCKVIDNDLGSFDTGIFDLEPGPHNLIVNIVTNTRSGSIADGLETEGFFYSKKFILMIREWSCAWSGNLSVNPVHKGLKLSWERYNGANFQEYVLIKQAGWLNMTMATITDQRDRTFLDSTYIGENADYKVELVTSDDRLTADGVNYKGKLPQLVVKEVNNTLLTLAWDSPEHLDNIDRYELYKITPDHLYELIAKITNLNDNFYVVDDLMFLHEHEFLFLPVPKYFPVDYQPYFFSLNDHFGSRAKSSIGEKFNAGTIVNALGDYFYFRSEHYIYEYDYVEDRTTRTIELTSPNSEFAVSANRKFILAADNRSSVLLYDFSRSRSYSLDQLADGFDMVSAPAISDNGIGIMRIFNSGSASNVDGNILVYDFVNERKIFQGPIGEGLTSSYKISADGKYICRDLHTVYLILNDNIILVPGITAMIADSDFFDFHPADPELFVYREQGFLYFTRISDLSTAFSCHMDPHCILYNIDYNVNKFMAYSEGKLGLYDLNSCEQLWSYPAKLEFSVRFSYNAVYDSRHGVRLKIE